MNGSDVRRTGVLASRPRTDMDSFLHPNQPARSCLAILSGPERSSERRVKTVQPGMEIVDGAGKRRTCETEL